jgi:glyoxylase-like metal-dependent hydrolase (beta-lactamase superfamily II)
MYDNQGEDRDLAPHHAGDIAVSNPELPTRRHLLLGAAATAAIGVGPRAIAKAPMANTPAPGFYRFRLGAFEATVVSDGPLSLGPPADNLFNGVSKQELTEVLARNFRATETVELDQNTLVVNTGANLVLFDTGTGKTLKVFGPHTGRHLDNLKAAGIDPNDIDTIALTHAHPDHCFGIMATQGARNFPNARIHIAQADFDFWTDESKATTDMFKIAIGGARQNLIPNRERIGFVKDGQEIVPGIQAMAAPGHTVGHTVYIITSEGKTLVNAGDIAHHSLISVERPDVEFAYDTDGKQAAVSRRRVFDMLASGRMPFIAYHFPWPGVGYLSKQGNGYRYVAETMRMVL